jgi:5-methylcytosine-specific restriction endonuclease McrA
MDQQPYKTTELQRSRASDYYRNNREKILARHRENRQARKEYLNKWRTKNKNHLKIYSQEYETAKRIRSKEERLRAGRRYMEKKGKPLRLRVIALLGGHCLHCGVTDPRVLEVDHINPRTKRFAMNTLSLMKRTEEELLEEVSRCQLLCANCHKIKTLENRDTVHYR